MTYLWPANFEVFGNLTGSDLKLQKGGGSKVVRIVVSKFEIMSPFRDIYFVQLWSKLICSEYPLPTDFPVYWRSIKPELYYTPVSVWYLTEPKTQIHHFRKHPFFLGRLMAFPVIRWWSAERHLTSWLSKPPHSLSAHFYGTCKSCPRSEEGIRFAAFAMTSVGPIWIFCRLVHFVKNKHTRSSL